MNKDIENLKNILVDLEDVENGAIINLSQEEINSLKSILESYVSKDKIRKKIKELEKKKNCGNSIVFWETSSQIDLLKELLEENKDG